jgi:hypothetical protein
MNEMIVQKVSLKNFVLLFVLLMKKTLQNIDLQGLTVLKVGVRRLELPTSTSRTWRASQLCYTPYLKPTKIVNFQIL